MSESLVAPPRTVPFKVTNPERIPAQRYYDDEFYRRETEELWPRVWQMACRLEEIPEIGDFVEYKNVGKSVIVVRTKTGIKAFHNACRHRGVKLASGHGNCKRQGLICPFHGWRWDMDGNNTYVHEPQLFSDENLAKVEINLIPCRLELWGGCAFINGDDNAEPLMDHVRASAERLDVRNIDQMKVEWWLSTVLPTNWKLAMEAFMEGYHTTRTHPQLVSASTPITHAYGGAPGNSMAKKVVEADNRAAINVAIEHMRLLCEGMGGMVHATDIAVAESLRDIDLPSDPAEAFVVWRERLNDEIVTQGRARGAAVPDLNALAKSNPAAPVEFIFPHYFLLPQYGNLSSYRIRPLGPESCLFELWALTLLPENEVRERPTAPIPTPYTDPHWPPIPKQDYANLPLQQEGLHSQGFEFMRLSNKTEGMISNYQRLIDGYLEGVDRGTLARACQIASNKLDGPIADLGF